MKLFLSTLTTLSLLAASCGNTGETASEIQQQPDETVSPPIHDEVNSVYYWKTVLHIDSINQNFIRRHNVGRIYMRMFDVVREPYPRTPADAAYPDATIRIDNHQFDLVKGFMRGVEIVPVVYITLDALRAMKGNEGIMAENIVTRVRNMTQYHELPNVRALQLDCDWTMSTQNSFFQLCDSVKNSIKQLDLSWNLSSTIRLHQLAQSVPPVDYGVLMVYNTGSFNNPDTHNSIIDIDDIRPYLYHLRNYELHLDIAYPTYSWQLMFRNRKFTGLTNGITLSDTTKFMRKNENQYIAKRDMPYNGKTILKGDMVRSEVSEYDEIIKVKNLIEQYLSGHAHSNIIYHLDSNNLSKYSPDEIQSIFSTCN